MIALFDITPAEATGHGGDHAACDAEVNGNVLVGPTVGNLSADGSDILGVQSLPGSLRLSPNRATDMLPCFASDGQSNRRSLQSKLLCHEDFVLSGSSPFAQRKNQSIGQDCVVVGLTSLVTRIAPSTSNLVSRVGQARSGVQMARPNTEWCVAVVTGHFSYLTGFKEECDPMCSRDSDLEGAITPREGAVRRIATGSRGPQPARVVIVHDVDLGPESPFDIRHLRDSAYCVLAAHGIGV